MWTGHVTLTIVIKKLFNKEHKHIQTKALMTLLHNSLGAETRTQKNSPHKCLIQILII